MTLCSVYDVLGVFNRIMWPSFMRSLICYTNIDTMFLGTCRITTDHMHFFFSKTLYELIQHSVCFESFW